MKLKKVIWLIGTSLLLSSCLKETDLPMAADFRATAKNDRQTAPVTVQLSNLSYGADTYMWTFEGGNPSSSSDKNPGEVVFAEAGNHKITLTAVNAVGQSVKDITITVYPQVSVGFGYVVQINDIAPAVVEIVNKTKGATAYEWHFEGGDPATSSSPNPGCVTFATGGKHEIRLRVTNGLEWFEQSDTVTLRNPMRADFEMQPLGIDEDMEAPVTMQLTNTSESAINGKWTAPGGTLSSDTARIATVRYAKPGTYTITLTVDDNKSRLATSRSITVKENNGLLVANNLRFGINEAKKTVGCFYSSLMNRVLTTSEVTDATVGKTIDIVFFGLNSKFGYCYFLSPTDAKDSAFPVIPGAVAATVNNKPEGIGQEQFDKIKKDTDFQTLSGWSGNKKDYFTIDDCPHFVLFKTADGRRGIIKVKEFVREGAASYVVADLKIEKRKDE